MGWFQHPDRGVLEDLADALHRRDDDAVAALADARTHCAECCECGRELRRLRAAREAVQCPDSVAASHQLASRITEALQSPAVQAAPLPALGVRRSWGNTMNGPSVLVACSVTLVMSAVVVLVWQTSLPVGGNSVAGDAVTVMELEPSAGPEGPEPVAGTTTGEFTGLSDTGFAESGLGDSGVAPAPGVTSPAVVRTGGTATPAASTAHTHGWPAHWSTSDTLDGGPPVATAALSICLEALGLTEDSVRSAHETTWLGDPAFSFYAHPPHGHTEHRYVVDRQCSEDDVLVRFKTDATSVTSGGK